MHLADAWNHLTSNGLRYISNPPGNTARVHQHMEMGRGEVDYDEVFAALAVGRLRRRASAAACSAGKKTPTASTPGSASRPRR